MKKSNFESNHPKTKSLGGVHNLLKPLPQAPVNSSVVVVSKPSESFSSTQTNSSLSEKK